MSTFNPQEGYLLIDRLILTIQQNKQYLSDIDGAIGDGDHGINMNKGFTICREALDSDPGPENLVDALNVLSKTLMMKIGGAMGPLYGSFFKAIAKSIEGKEQIGRDDFVEAISSAVSAVQVYSNAKPGDKTMMDVLIPAKDAFSAAVTDDLPFGESLNKMSEAARKGRDSTENMTAKIGRASRLGERSRGVIDAGAASSCLILETLANGIKELIQKDKEG